MDRLGFWGRWCSRRLARPRRISVSADGSTWFLGLISLALGQVKAKFQYPLMDRLGFWGRRTSARPPRAPGISVSADGSTWFLG